MLYCIMRMFLRLSLIIGLILGFSSLNLQAQNSYVEYADSTQLLLVFDDERDTAAINSLKRELQATELASTPYTRIHLWQIPFDTVAASGGASQVLNRALGKPRIKGGGLNYSVPMIFNVDDDDDDQSEPQSPLCFNDSLFDCLAGPSVVRMAFLDTGFDGDPTGNRSVWMPSHNQFRKRPLQNSGESGKSLNVDNDKNGFIDDVKGWDFHFNDNSPVDDHGHGSHTAGIAALKQFANGDSNRNAILMLKTHNQAGEASMWQLVQALDYALSRDIRIVNLSLAYWAPVNPNGKPNVMEYLMEFAKTYKGTLFVAAAGNESINIDAPVTLPNGVQVRYFPAAAPNENLIVVAAGTCSNELAPFSNYGPVNVDIAAPGIEIYSALLEGTYGYLTGTSMAAPHVTAAAALAGSRQSVFDWKKIKYDLLNRTQPAPALNGLVSSGRMLTFCDNYSGSNAPLLVTVKADKILCVGKTSTLSANVTGGQPPYSFSWSGGGNSVSRVVQLPGVYTVTVTDGAGNSATESVTVYSAAAPITETILQPYSCGQSCTILEIVDPVPGAEYVWNNGQKKTQINVCPGNASVYTVTTTLPNGCTGTTSVAVPRLNPQVVALKDTAICPCGAAQLSAVASGGLAPLSYTWSNLAVTSPSVTVSPLQEETYEVLITDQNGCTVSSDAKVSVACLAPEALSAVLNPLTGRTTFLWSKGPCPINRTQLRWRCSTSDPWTTVTINDTSVTQRVISLPAGCTPVWQVRTRCCNNVNSLWDSPPANRLENNSAEVNTEQMALRLYPNPAGEIIYLESDDFQSGNIVYIYNIFGQMVMFQELNPESGTVSVDINQLSPGVYMLRYGNEVKTFSKR